MLLAYLFLVCNLELVCFLKAWAQFLSTICQTTKKKSLHCSRAYIALFLCPSSSNASIQFLWFAVIVPAFHSSFLEAMVNVFTDCSERTMLKFEKHIESDNPGEKTVELDLEAEFSSLALDIIGLGVFNYDFGSVTKESPVIKV